MNTPMARASWLSLSATCSVSGNRLFINMKLWRKTNLKVRTIKVFENDAEIEEMTEHDHQKNMANS
jgi:hypothetical protein